MDTRYVSQSLILDRIMKPNSALIKKCFRKTLLYLVLYVAIVSGRRISSSAGSTACHMLVL